MCERRHSFTWLASLGPFETHALPLPRAESGATQQRGINHPTAKRLGNDPEKPALGPRSDGQGSRILTAVRLGPRRVLHVGEIDAVRQQFLERSKVENPGPRTSLASQAAINVSNSCTSSADTGSARWTGWPMLGSRGGGGRCSCCSSFAPSASRICSVVPRFLRIRASSERLFDLGGRFEAPNYCNVTCFWLVAASEPLIGAVIAWTRWWTVATEGSGIDLRIADPPPPTTPGTASPPEIACRAHWRRGIRNCVRWRPEGAWWRTILAW